ncbi:MAG TPA: cyclase family protein [Chloroflexota bacterium]|nr:cyclase family protein [Chloroflexota bacterium]
MLLDVSHTIEDGIITYKGLPAPVVCDFLSREASRVLYAPGTEFHIGKIEMVANTGTYLDSPFHRFADGLDIADLPLAGLVNLEGIVIRAVGHGRTLTPALFQNHELAGKAVLVHTGWDQHWRTDQYFEGHPFLTEATAVYLKEAGAALVGIDSLNIDDTADGRRPVHTTLLGSQIPVVEHLCRLEQLPDSGFRFFAAPVKVRGMGTFPIRAYAIS